MEKNFILQRAKSAVISHDFGTAVRLYKELLSTDPSNIEYLNEIGGIYVKSGEDDKAIPYYQKIHAHNPNDVNAMNCLGAIFRRLKRYNESIEILQKALKTGNELTNVNYNMGFTYKDMGRYDDAIDAFETVIATNPDDVLTYNHLGCIYLIQKKYEKSVTAFRRGLQIDRNHPILNYNLARCYTESKNYPEAIRCFEICLKTRPGWLDAIKDFSDLLIKCQKSKEASSLVNQTLKLHPRDAELLYILGKIYLSQYDYENASETLEKANSIKQNDIKILSGLTEALEKGEKPEEAVETVLEALELDPLNKDLRKQYAEVLLSAKNLDSAKDTIEGLYEETGDTDMQVLDLYGQYYICKGQDDKAAECFDTITKTDEKYNDYMLSASKRYRQSGKFDNAEKYAKDFIQKNNTNPEGYNNLGRVYAAAGQIENAKASYSKGLSLRKVNVYADKELKALDERMKALQAEKSADDIMVEELDKEDLKDLTVENLVENSDEDFDYDQMGGDVSIADNLTKQDFDLFDTLDDELAEEYEDEDELNIVDEVPDFTGSDAPVKLSDEEMELAQAAGDNLSMKNINDSLPEDKNPFPIENKGLDFGSPVKFMNNPEEENSEEETPENNTSEIFENPAAERGNQTGNPMSADDAFAQNFDDERFAKTNSGRQLEQAAKNADLAVETAMNAQKMMSQVMDDQAKFREDMTKQMDQMQQKFSEIQKPEAPAASEITPEFADEPLSPLGTTPDADTESAFGTTPDADTESAFDTTSAGAETETDVDTTSAAATAESDFDTTSAAGAEEQSFEPEVAAGAEDAACNEEPAAALSDEPFATVEELSTQLGTESETETTAEPLTSEPEIQEEVDFPTVEDFADNADTETALDTTSAGAEEQAFEPEVAAGAEDAACNEEPAAALSDEPFATVEELSTQLGTESETETTAEPLTSEPEIQEEVDFPTVEDFADDAETETDLDTTSAAAAESAFDTTSGAAAAESDLDTTSAGAEEQAFEPEVAAGAEDAACNEEPAATEDAACNEEPAATEDAACEPEVVMELQDNSFDDLDVLNSPDSEKEMLSQIQKMLNDGDFAKQNLKNLELLKAFKELTKYLPVEERVSFNTGRQHMMIEYLISKMSGKPGLLLTAEGLIKSGVMGKNYDSQVTKECQMEYGPELIREVFSTVKKLSDSLEDKGLGVALKESADIILEKVELS